MAKQSIAQTLQTKIDGIKAEQEKLAVDLKHWLKVQSDYETNKVTIESILSVHNAPDVSGGGAVGNGKRTRRPRQKKLDSGFSTGN